MALPKQYPLQMVLGQGRSEWQQVRYQLGDGPCRRCTGSRAGPQIGQPLPQAPGGAERDPFPGQPLPCARRGCSQLPGTSPLPLLAQQQGLDPLHSSPCSACGPLPVPPPGPSNGLLMASVCWHLSTPGLNASSPARSRWAGWKFRQWQRREHGEQSQQGVGPCACPDGEMCHSWLGLRAALEPGVQRDPGVGSW